MNIYINARFLISRPTGVERYAYEMCRALVKEGADIMLVCPKQGEINEAYDISSFNITRFGIGKSHFWEQLVLPFYFIGKKNYLVVSFTGLGSILVPHKIMTIHDLSFLMNPSWFSKTYYWYYRMLTPLAVKTSKFIITVSNFSKCEILRFYQFLKPEKIHVVYNAVNKNKFSVKNIDTNNGGTPYILAVSSIDPRKNFSKLREAFKEGIDGCRLKIVGGSVSKIFSTGKYEDLKNSDHIDFLGRVTDEELVQLYANALGFVYPSLYEGFGLPPIEAMTEGCPVAVSDIPVMHEVCGNAAIFFNPLNENEIHNAVHELITMSSEERSRMINLGYKNIERFSWNKSAKEILNYLNFTI